MIITGDKEDTRMVYIQRGKLGKYKMASSGFTFVQVLRFGNEFLKSGTLLLI